MRALVFLMAFLVAGCSDGGGAGPAASTSGTGTAPGSPGNATVMPPVAVDHPVSWEGAVVAGAWWCEGVVFGECRAAPDDAAFGVDHVVDGLAGNVSGELSLAWTPQNAMTDQLVLDAAVLTPGCDDCAFTQVAHTAGLSPLSITLQDVPLPEGAVLRLSVYVDKYVEGGPVPATVGGSGDQSFLVEGTLAMLP